MGPLGVAAPTVQDAAQTSAAVKLSILLPVRYEGINIPLILKILHAVVEVPHEVLVVYDEPDDDSVPAVQLLQPRFPHVRLIYNTLGAGVAQAIRAGVQAARGDHVLLFAVDDLGPVMALDEMLRLMEQGYDLVSGTRYAGGGRRLGGSLTGRFLSRLANWSFQWLAGGTLTDATTGIKLVRRSVFEQIRLEAAPVGWAVAFELAIKAQLAGLRLGEVPIISIDRPFGGTSSFSIGPWVLQYLRWFVWGTARLRFRQAWQRPARTGGALRDP